MAPACAGVRTSEITSSARPEATAAATRVSAATASSRPQSMLKMKRPATSRITACAVTVTKTLLNLPLRIVCRGVGVVNSRGSVPARSSSRIVRATLLAPKNMKKIIMPARMVPVTPTSLVLSPPGSCGARCVTLTPAAAPPSRMYLAAACRASLSARAPAPFAVASRLATTAAARAPLKPSSAWPTMLSVMAPPISCVGFSYTSMAVFGAVELMPTMTPLKSKGMITAAAAVPSSTLLRAAAADGLSLTVMMSLRSGLFMTPTTTAPAFSTGPASPVSALATATLVAEIEKLWPLPKAKPSRAARASGASSIMASAGTLRMVLRRSFQAMARMRLNAVLLPQGPAGEVQEHHLEVGLGDVHLGDARACRGSSRRPPRQDLVGILHQQHGMVFVDHRLADTVDLRPAFHHPLEVVVDAELHVSFLTDDLHELVVGPDGDHLAVVDDADAIAELLRLGHVVGRVQDRHALVAEREDAVEDRAPALRVDAHCRLVQVQDAGFVQQGHADVDAPLHAAAELLHAVLLTVDQRDEREHLVHPRVQLGSRETVHLAPEQQVLAGAHVGIQGDVLGDHADRLFDRMGVGDHGAAVYEGVAAAGVQQAREHGDGGALAGAVGPEQAEDLAPGDVEADAIDGEHSLGRVVPLAQLLDLDDAHRPTLPVRDCC